MFDNRGPKAVKLFTYKQLIAVPTLEDRCIQHKTAPIMEIGELVMAQQFTSK